MQRAWNHAVSCSLKRFLGATSWSADPERETIAIPACNLRLFFYLHAGFLVVEGAYAVFDPWA